MAELLKDPSDYIRVHSKAELTFYASLVFEHLKQNHGDLRLWWKNYHHYSNYKEGGAHFWKRISFDCTYFEDEYGN